MSSSVVVKENKLDEVLKRPDSVAFPAKVLPFPYHRYGDLFIGEDLSGSSKKMLLQKHMLLMKHIVSSINLLKNKLMEFRGLIDNKGDLPFIKDDSYDEKCALWHKKCDELSEEIYRAVIVEKRLREKFNHIVARNI